LKKSRHIDFIEETFVKGATIIREIHQSEENTKRNICIITNSKINMELTKNKLKMLLKSRAANVRFAK
jgi:hypothetical protein